MIIKTTISLFNYLKKPVLFHEKESSKKQFHLFINLLITCIIFGLLTSPIFILVETLGIVNLQDHKVETFLKSMSPFQVILLGGILVPVIEELLFRAPITLFKNPKTFTWAFYLFTITFGFIHITNFNITTSVLLLSPILVIPQLFIGLALGYIRVKQGLLWSIALHSVYNSIFLSLSLLAENIA